MSEHDLDLVSLVGGIVFLALGVVGLLRVAGWVDDGAVFWAAVAVVVGLGILGVARSLRALARPADGPADAENAQK